MSNTYCCSTNTNPSTYSMNITAALTLCTHTDLLCIQYIQYTRLRIFSPPEKMCLNRQCQNVSEFGVHECSGKCSGRGVSCLTPDDGSMLLVFCLFSSGTAGWVKSCTGTTFITVRHYVDYLPC